MIYVTILGRIGRTGDIRSLVLEGPSPAAMKGPLLGEVRYPDVLVAKAFSTGADLQLVLYPGSAVARQRLQIERLDADREYRLESTGQSQTFRADANGKAAIDVDLVGRTEVHIQPLQS